jgi:hypothetical protein
MAASGAICPVTFRLAFTVHRWFSQLRVDGTWGQGSPAGPVRVREGLGEHHSAALDYQSVLNAGPGDEVGFEGGKGSGRERHAILDRLGF